jgi:hypothetical protein
MERLFRAHYHLWSVLNELRSSPDPRALLRRWRLSRPPAQEWRKAVEYARAINVLTISLSLPLEDTEALVEEYIGAAETNEAAV